MSRMGLISWVYEGCPIAEPTITLADRKDVVVSIAKAVDIIDTYPPLTLSLYDRLDGDAFPDKVTPDDIGRLIIIEPLQQTTACSLLESQFSWHLVPVGSRLEDADPEGDLYANATVLFDEVDAISGVGSAIASKVLHLKRPEFFPILDSQILDLYKRSAAVAYQASTVWKRDQPKWKHLYWAAIRNDLINPGNVEALRTLRARLTEAGADATNATERRRAADLGNLRLLDILAWSFTRK